MTNENISGTFARLREKLADVPVAKLAEDVVKSVVDRGRVTILRGDTGSGKTLYANSLLADYLNEQVVVLVPRRALAINAASTVANLSGLRLGLEVGYAVGARGEEGSSYSKDTKLVFATSGYALSSGLIKKAKNIVVDEVHEGGADVSLVRAILHARLPDEDDLNVMEMSATIDAEKQAAYWQDVAKTDIHYADGNVFPCEIRHIKPDEKTIQETAIDLVREGRKGIAVFRPGKKEAEYTAQRVRWLAEELGLNIEISTVYRGKDSGARFKALKAPEPGQSKILIGTDIMETGLNLPWLDAGVSDGTAKIPLHADIGGKGLELIDLPQWRLKQQQGRVNRFQPGIFIINADKGFDERPETFIREIGGAELTHLAWQAVSLGYDPETLKYDEQINISAFEKAKQELLLYGLIHDNWYPTPAGRFAARFPVEPAIAAMLWEAKELGVLKNGIQLAAIMAARGLRKDLYRPHFTVSDREETTIPQSDILDSLRAYQEFQQGLIHDPHQFNIDTDRLSEAEESIQTITERCPPDDLEKSKLAASSELRQLILCANRASLFEKLNEPETWETRKARGLLEQDRIIFDYRNAISGTSVKLGNSPSVTGKNIRFIVGDVWQLDNGRNVINNRTHITTEDILAFAARHPGTLEDKSFFTAGNGKDYLSFSYYGGRPIILPLPSEISLELQSLLGSEYAAFLKQKIENYYAAISTKLDVELERITDAFKADGHLQAVLDRTINSDLYDAQLPVYCTIGTQADKHDKVISRFRLAGNIVNLEIEEGEELSAEQLQALQGEFPQLFPHLETKTPKTRKAKTAGKISEKSQDKRKIFDEDITSIIDKECKLRRVNGLVTCPMGLVSDFGSKYATWARDNSEPVAILDRSNVFQGGFIPADILPEIANRVSPKRIEIRDFKSDFLRIKGKLETQPIFVLESQEGSLAAYVSADIFEEAKKKIYVTKAELEAELKAAEAEETTERPIRRIEKISAKEAFIAATESDHGVITSAPKPPVAYEVKLLEAAVPIAEPVDERFEENTIASAEEEIEELPVDRRGKPDITNGASNTEAELQIELFEIQSVGSVPTEGRTYLQRVAKEGKPIVVIDMDIAREPRGVFIPENMAQELSHKEGVRTEKVNIRQFCEGYKKFRKGTEENVVYVIARYSDIKGYYALPQTLSKIGIKVIVPDAKPPKASSRPSPFSLRLSDEERIRLDRARGTTAVSTYIKQRLFEDSSSNLQFLEMQDADVESFWNGSQITRLFNIQNPSSVVEVVQTLEAAESHAYSDGGYVQIRTPNNNLWIVTETEALEYLSSIQAADINEANDGKPIHSSIFPKHEAGTFKSTIETAYAFKIACTRRNAIIDRESGQRVAFIGNTMPLVAYSLAKRVLILE